ncbi:hypothetical protein JMM59_09735 [Rhodovulum sulfidophilum]|uniref:hypothetical protein n=1 Tax=Rhodovulum sulfidophilum TaxID=35806 RepID=UPI001920B290|nr:hypothetical protein [Rhodovulum sulfidophilum]MBL3565281.1 hypothetical protein [Rhodovulum sulfidophilum]
MPELTLQCSRWPNRTLAGLLVMGAMATPVAEAQQSFSLDQLSVFAHDHSCVPDHQITNNTQYLTWIEALASLVDGSLPPAAFLDCDTPLFGFAETLNEAPLNPDDWRDLRETLISWITPETPDPDPVQARISQGYAAADYAATVFLLCQADQPCFEVVTQADGFEERICPEPVPDGFDNTSPDVFELKLFKHGGDMRQFLPYLLTNCRLMAAAENRGDMAPIHNTLMQALRLR